MGTNSGFHFEHCLASLGGAMGTHWGRSESLQISLSYFLGLTLVSHRSDEKEAEGEGDPP